MALCCTWLQSRIQRPLLSWAMAQFLMEWMARKPMEVLAASQSEIARASPERLQLELGFSVFNLMQSVLVASTC